MFRRSVVTKVVPLLVVAAMGLAACSSSGISRSEESGEVAEATSADLNDVVAGDCVRDSTDFAEVASSIEIVPCAEDHNAQAFLVAEIADRDDYDQEALDEEIAVRCAAQFETFVGSPVGESDYLYYWYTPTPSAWEGGDRDFTCYVWADGDDIAGSLEGSET